MIQILDSTLREGEQTPGVYFSPEIKLEIARLLDCLGVDIIEVGNPAVNPEIAASVTQIARAGLQAKIGAHSLCRIPDVQKALACDIDFLGVFFSVSQKRLERDYEIELSAAIDKIVEVITYARSQNPNLLIRYTPEDTVRSSISDAIAASVAAVTAGANIISIADTTGYATPFHPHRSYAYYVKALKQGLADRHLFPKIEVHCHNDRGLALANALDAVRAGADIIDVTVMGIGERSGIVDLAELTINLMEILEDESVWKLNHIQELYRLVSDRAYIAIPPHRPIVGKNAFTHYAGVHVNAIAKDEFLYQSLNPEIFGIKSQFALGMQSGQAALEMALKQIGQGDLVRDREFVANLLEEIKEIAKRGTPIDIENELPEIVERYRMSELIANWIYSGER
ncbi:MAG TPA: 2-isopropylmalate synthase [Oscillatoriales cyanobacterium M59_W2019_021]|nr:MAG: 2-isopropylmalate synthase [Cyanobacteria bacterium J055]HIK30265.1 2-isopropylmalate synthase [Oscillatoriales cyanobacterium M4454_W2019_049]HIK53410.1 2-isopropylmalate synthase [Oscillatoriales cyanobacterium M59_W2019_021]